MTTWWNFHELGTNDRPRPGSRLRLVDGRGAVVLPYEGCWPLHTFPVRIDGDPGSRIAIPADIDRQAMHHPAALARGLEPGVAPRAPLHHHRKGLTMGNKHEDKTDQDTKDQPHKPQGTAPQGPPDPDKPDGGHTK